MIYDKLRTLPKVIQLEIYQSGDVSLLSDEGTSLDVLSKIWENLDHDFNNRYNKTQKSKIFNLSKEIDYQENRFTIVKSACESLLFNRDKSLIELLKAEGYRFIEDEYLKAIDQISREADAILIKINQLKKQFPETSGAEEYSGSGIIGVMASYSAVLGVGFDFNTCSVEAFHGYEEQVKEKMNAIKAQSQKNKR